MTAGVIGRIAPLVILLLLLTSCSSIPTAGPVGTIEATAEAETGARFVNNPPPPREGGLRGPPPDGLR